MDKTVVPSVIVSQQNLDMTSKYVSGFDLNQCDQSCLNC